MFRRLLTLLLGIVLLSSPLVMLSPVQADPAVAGDGVISWGGSSGGQLAVPASLTDKTVTAISTGFAHSMALTDDGTVTAWGYNDFGQRDVPASLTGKTVTAISSGDRHSLALTDDGTVTAWGNNGDGQATVPASLTGKTVIAISAGGSHSLALTDDGTITGWGHNASGRATAPASLTGKTVTAISAGDSHSLALTDDGIVTAWGNNDFRQTIVPASLTGKMVTAISAGDFHSLALTVDGTITAWGDNSSGQTAVPASLTGKRVTAISAGYTHSLALTDDGTVTGWGNNGSGQTDVPASLSGKTVTAIAAGDNHSLAAYVTPEIVTGLTDDAARITAGESTTFTPTVSDAVADVASTWTAAGTDVTASINPTTGAITLSSTKAGTHLVTVTIPTNYRSLTATIELTVTPTAVASLGVIWPSSALFGDAVSYTFTGTDRYDNLIGDVTDEVRIDSSDSSDTISGATVTAGSLGLRTLTATHTATGVTSSTSLAVIARTFTTDPSATISGVVKVGEELTADAGAVSPVPDSISLQWFADNTPIAGATTDTFTPTNTQRGTKLSVKATALRVGYTDASHTSTQTAPVASRNAPTVNLKAAKTALRRGQGTTLTWSTTDATTVTGSGSWTGAQQPSGTLTVRPGLGSNTWVLAATNDQGTTTAQTSVSVTRQATKLKVTTSSKVRAGKKATVKVTGLDPAEPYTIKLSGKDIKRGKADARGKVQTKITVPASSKPGRRTISVTGSEKDRAGRTTIKVTRKLKVTLAKKRVQASDPQKVTVTGLLSGEKITLTYGGRTTRGVANSKGVYTIRFTVGLNWETITVKAKASVSGTAKKSFKVVRRTHDLSPRWR